MAVSSLWKVLGALAGGVVTPAAVPVSAAVGSVAVGNALTAMGGLSGALVGSSGANAIVSRPTLSEQFDDTQLYNTKEVAQKLGVTEYTVRKKIREGKLPACVITGKKGYFVSEADIATYLHTDEKNTPVVVEPPDNSFEAKVQSLVADIASTPNITPEIIKEVIRGCEIDLDGLKLKLKRLELDGNGPDDIEFEKRKTDLEIAINDLRAKIQAYKTILNPLENLRG